MENKIKLFSDKFENSNKNIEKSKKTINSNEIDAIEFIVFLERNKQYFKNEVFKYDASSRLLYLDTLILRTSFYRLKDYEKNKNVKLYLFKNRFYTTAQYEVLSLILSIVTAFVLVGLFSLFIPNITVYVIASCLASAAFYLFDVYEFIL